MIFTVVEIRYFVDGERHTDVDTFDDEPRARKEVETLEGFIAANGYTHAENELRAPSYVVRHDPAEAEPGAEPRARKRK